MSIQKLRDRVAQLDLENTALARAAKPIVPEYDMNSVDGIVSSINDLKDQLKVVNEKSLHPAENIEGKKEYTDSLILFLI